MECVGSEWASGVGTSPFRLPALSWPRYACVLENGKSPTDCQCWLQTSGPELVTITFSPLGVNGLALDKCGCHQDSLVMCSYDDTKSGLGCPAGSPGDCSGGDGSGPDGPVRNEGVDGIEDIDVQRNVQASGGQANDNAPAPDDPIKGGQQSSQQGAGGGGVGTANTDQSGTGWTGLDLLDSASTSTYSAPSLDALLNIPSSLVPKELSFQADIIDAIRRVSSETGVPSGLLAAMIIQESNGDRTTITDNDGYSSQPPDQQKDIGIIQSPLWAFPGSTTAEKIRNGQDPYQNLSVFAAEAAETYKKTKSWGQVAQYWYTGQEAARLGDVTGGLSQERNYVLNVFGNLAMGGSTYYPAGGY